MSTKANTVFYSTWTCTLLPNSQLFMYPMDSDVSMCNLHTISYSSELEEPLIHDDAIHSIQAFSVLIKPASKQASSILHNVHHVDFSKEK